MASSPLWPLVEYAFTLFIVAGVGSLILIIIFSHKVSRPKAFYLSLGIAAIILIGGGRFILGYPLMWGIPLVSPPYLLSLAVLGWYHKETFIEGVQYSQAFALAGWVVGSIVLVFTTFNYIGQMNSLILSFSLAIIQITVFTLLFGELIRHSFEWYKYSR